MAAIAVLAGPLVPSTGLAAEPRPASLIKAAIVFNLARFVSWPQSRSSPRRSVVVGVVGAGDTADALLALNGKSSGVFTLRVLRVNDWVQVATCNAVYFADMDTGERRAYLTMLADGPVLTLSDAETFMDEGGMVQLSIREDRVHLTVLLEKVKSARLRMPAQVLKIVEVVRDK